MSRHTPFFACRYCCTLLITSLVDHVVQLYPSRITSGISTIMCNLLWSKEGPVNLPPSSQYWGYYLDKYKVFACLWSLMRKGILISLYNCRYDISFHLIFFLLYKIIFKKGLWLFSFHLIFSIILYFKKGMGVLKDSGCVIKGLVYSYRIW